MFSKPGILFIVQVDHLSGEIAGSAIEFFYAAGAANVNVLATVTKKNRPGHIFIIDGHPDAADAIEEVIMRELGSSGWHRMETIHRHVKVEPISRDIIIRCDNRFLPFLAEGKRIIGKQVNLRPEHGNCVFLRSEIEAHFQKKLSLQETYQLLLNILHNTDDSEFTL